jgi:hypothetical protein
MEQMLQDARAELLTARADLRWARRHNKLVPVFERVFLVALDRVWAVQCMLNPSLS